jgi:hypothetical protein
VAVIGTGAVHSTEKLVSDDVLDLLPTVDHTVVCVHLNIDRVPLTLRALHFIDNVLIFLFDSHSKQQLSP